MRRDIRLPAAVHALMDQLESHGHAAYAVGGCVRDSLLGLAPHDYDLCTDAMPDTVQTLFARNTLVLAGVKHGTVGVVTEIGVVEITTFRTEGDYADHRHPGWVRFVADVRGDLARRDFTVNAMAYSPTRGFADPFGGQADLEAGVLRCVGDPEERFREDPLRILRGIRFAANYRLSMDAQTWQAMLALRGLLDTLARERVMEELCKLLPASTVPELLRDAPILAQVIPGLGACIGFDQRNPHHKFDLYTHIAHVVAGVRPELPLRWAALLHDLGKVPTCTLDETGRGHFKGHAQVSAQMAAAILTDLRAPKALRERVVWLIERHMSLPAPDRATLRKQCSRWGEEPLRQLLALQRADSGGKGMQEPSPLFDETEAILEEICAQTPRFTLADLAVDGNDLMALGFRGRQIGQKLNELLTAVLEERLPNEREALLDSAKA